MASRICNRSLSILLAIIVVFSTRIFRNLDLGIEWVLRCKAIEIESLQCTVSRLQRVVVVKPTLSSLETQSHKGHLNIYIDVCLTKKFSPIALMKLTQYKRPFEIILLSISHKKSISTIKFHFLVY